jgi:hypothetical protein
VSQAPSAQSRPHTVREVWNVLVEIFSDFCEECTADELAKIESDGYAMKHSVMHHFAYYFGCHQMRFSKQQLTKLGTLLSEAVSVDDDLENAVSTCFLEHLRQLEGYKVLGPFLSADAKRKTHP